MFRPSDGAMTEFGAAQTAEIGGPGMLWNVADVWKPHHGSGTVADALNCVSHGTLTLQNCPCEPFVMADEPEVSGLLVQVSDGFCAIAQVLVREYTSLI